MCHFGHGEIPSQVRLQQSLLRCLASLALIIVIVGVAYFVASGHDIQIPDLANGGFFSQGETVLTDTSILVTYVALVAAFVTAIATEIYGAFK